MAWIEQIGTRSWRVRYRTGDGHTASISGFTTKPAAENYAADIDRPAEWCGRGAGAVTG